jgi:peptidyl-dipeptidase Dcp
MKAGRLIILIFCAIIGAITMHASGQNAADLKDNPFLSPYKTPLETPPFGVIKNTDFLPALKEGIRLQNVEVDAIVKDPDPPTFANTIGAYDRTGYLLAEVSAVFSALQGADTNPEIQGIAKEVAPLMAAHSDNIRLNEKLFARVKKIFDQRSKLTLKPEERFLLENTYRDFVRGGALLDSKQKERLRDLNQQLAKLSLEFGENMLAETNDIKMVLENRNDLAGNGSSRCRSRA